MGSQEKQQDMLFTLTVLTSFKIVTSDEKMNSLRTVHCLLCYFIHSEVLPLGNLGHFWNYTNNLQIHSFQYESRKKIKLLEIQFYFIFFYDFLDISQAHAGLTWERHISPSEIQLYSKKVKSHYFFFYFKNEMFSLLKQTGFYYCLEIFQRTVQILSAIEST